MFNLRLELHQNLHPDYGIHVIFLSAVSEEFLEKIVTVLKGARHTTIFIQAFKRFLDSHLDLWHHHSAAKQVPLKTHTATLKRNKCNATAQSNIDIKKLNKCHRKLYYLIINPQKNIKHSPTRHCAGSSSLLCSGSLVVGTPLHKEVMGWIQSLLCAVVYDDVQCFSTSEWNKTHRKSQVTFTAAHAFLIPG